MQAWKETSRAYPIDIVETVKNRVLDFALQLETEHP